MARGSSLLSSPVPSTAAPASVTIGHIQLRDVLICAHEKGVVAYPQDRHIIEHDLVAPNTTLPRSLVSLSFIPNSLTSLNVPNTDDTLLAAGGQDAELHLSYYSSACSSEDDGRHHPPSRGFGRRRWESKYTMDVGSSINNSVLLTSLSLTSSHESSAEPRAVVSNNDKTVKFFDVAVRSCPHGGEDAPRLNNAGQLRLDVPVNHSSISPDGRTLLCVGDSPEAYLYRLTGGARVSFAPIATLSLASHIPYSASAASASSVPASFSSAFSSDGLKFAVGSQEGAVVVWDVRSTKPLKVFQTDSERPVTYRGNGGASGWLSDTPWDWASGRGRAPGWGVRSVKFSPPGVGREVMTFTEHTSLLHVVDARTFEQEEVVRMPYFSPSAAPVPAPRPRSVSPPRAGSLAGAGALTEPLPLPPPRIVLFSGALEDTFRIPDVSARWRPRPSRRVRQRDDLPGDDAGGIVVIPPLGDREVEDDVRRLLGRHGLRTRTAADGQDGVEWRPEGVGEEMAGEREENEEAEEDDNEDGDGHGGGGTGEGEGEGEGEMDVDELESDCFSSHTPSRAPSPGAGAGAAAARAHVVRPSLLARRENASARRAARQHWRAARAGAAAAAVPDVEQDLAGMCFDPCGACVYVAATLGVAEWRVRGAEQRWWADTAWA